MPKFKKIASQIKKTAKKKRKKKKKSKIKTENILSSGSTLLNLACTNNPFGALTKGKYSLLVGDSSSGKTFLSLTCFAEALNNPSFKNYRLIYDNVELGMGFDLEGLFNKAVAKKVEPPCYGEDGLPSASFSVEDFYYNLDDCLQHAIKNKTPFIYVLDSMDSLSSVAEVKKFDEHKTAHRKGTKEPGSYGDGKAKKNSEGLRKILSGLQKTGSILIIISQTRDNIGFGFETKTRSGGHALKFYAWVEIWSTVTGQVIRSVKGKKRKIGVHVELRVKKNRTTGELHQIKMDIYPSYGIDDRGSCIDYLVEEKWWNKAGTKIVAKEFDITCTKDKLIKHIEENNLGRKLQIITGRCWKEIRESCKLDRKKRY